MTTSIPPAARSIRKMPMLPSAAASRSLRRCCAGAGCWKPPRRPEVKIVPHRLLGLLLAGFLVAGSGVAQAHPHVWITATSELLYAPDGSITGVRHAWTFDDMFSTYATQGIEAKQQAAFTPEELAPVAETNISSMQHPRHSTFPTTDATQPTSPA